MWDHFKKFKKPIQPIQPIQETKTKRIKILTSIKTLERLPIALVQTKAGHASYNNKIKSIEMGTITMNSKNSKTSYTHKLLKLPRGWKSVALSNCSVYCP